MNARQVGASIRTLLLVTIITLVVWLLAESRMVQTREVRLRLTLVSTPNSAERPMVIRPAPGEVWNGTVTVELEGSLASLDAATREMRGTLDLLIGQQVPQSVGVHELDLRTILRENPVLRSQGVGVRSLSTDVAVVEVDEITTLQIPVDVVLPEGTRLEAPARTQPESVTVRGPRSVVARFEGTDAKAVVPEMAMASLTPGQFGVVPGVQARLPSIELPREDAWIPTVSPTRVEVRLTLRTLAQSVVVERLPIQVLLAPGEIGRWDVRMNPGDEDLVQLRLEGPTEAIESIRDGSVAPRAMLVLSFQELEQGITTKAPVVLGLPEGVRIRSQIPQIGFTVTPARAPAIEGAADPG